MVGLEGNARFDQQIDIHGLSDVAGRADGESANDNVLRLVAIEMTAELDDDVERRLS